MPFDLSDSVPIAVDIKDSTGALANAASVTLTITLPDGTTATPTVSNPPAVTGQYRVTYVPVQEGRHVVRWVTTTPNTSYVDVFDVREAASPALLSLADMKAHLDIPTDNTSNDDELRDFIEAATAIVEQYVGPIVRRTHSTEVDGGACLINLPHTQVTAITALTLVRDGSSPLSSLSDIHVDSASGVISLKSGGAFPVGRLAITYAVGRAVIKRHWSLAARKIVRRNWDSQLRNQPALQGDYDDIITDSGFRVPDGVIMLLAPDDVPIGFG